jgi:hypothetical protein
MTRRTAIQLAFIGAGPFRLAAAEFWNKKPSADWSGDEIQQIISHSPWAKDVNADFETDSDYTVNGNEGPTIGRGGVIEAPGSQTASSGQQYEIGRNREDAQRGARRRQPVTVLWQSAQPIQDAAPVPLGAAFKDRYAISVSGLPLGVMERPRRQGAPAPAGEDNSPAARRSRMIEELQAAATLGARGKETAQAGIVMPVPRTTDTYLFGFSKDLLPLTANDREVTFMLQTAMLTVKAKFEPKEMLYRGKLAL